MSGLRLFGAGVALATLGGFAASAPPPGHGGGGVRVGGVHAAPVHAAPVHAPPVNHGAYHVNPGVHHGNYHPGYHTPGYPGGYYRPGISIGVGVGSPYYRAGYGGAVVIGGTGYRPGYYGGYGGYGGYGVRMMIPVPVTSPYLMASPPVVAAPPVPTAPQSAPSAAPSAQSAPATGETALQVTDVSDGPAARAGLRAGDVIYAANGVRVQSGDDLRKVVGSAAEVEIEFLKPQDGKTAAVKMTPVNGRIGVTVEPIPVEFRK